MTSIVDPVVERLPSDLQLDLSCIGKVMPLRHGKSGRKGFRVTFYGEHSIESIEAALNYHGYELVSYTEHKSGKIHFVNVHEIKMN